MGAQDHVRVEAAFQLGLRRLAGDDLFLVVERLVVVHEVVVLHERVVDPLLVLPGDDVGDLLVLEPAGDGDVLIAADVHLHAVADRHVLRRRAADVGQVLVLVLGEEPHHAVGQRREAEVLHRREFLLFALLVEQFEVLEAIELVKNVAAIAVAELIETLQRHFADLHRHQPLGLLVADILAAFDGEEEVLGEALFDDRFRPRVGSAAAPSAAASPLATGVHLAADLDLGFARACPGSRPLPSPRPRARRRPAGQVGDLLDQIDLAHDQPRLGVVVEFARVVEHAHVAGQVQLGLVLVGDAHVVGRPGDAAGEVADFDGNLAGQLALDVPLQGVVAAGGERGVDQIDLLLVVQDAEVDAGRVDQRVGPRELDAVDPLLDRQQAMLADHGDVFGVVDRQLRPLAAGERDEVHGRQGRMHQAGQDGRGPPEQLGFACVGPLRCASGRING